MLTTSIIAAAQKPEGFKEPEINYGVLLLGAAIILITLIFKL